MIEAGNENISLYQQEDPNDLYQAALEEDTLTIYSVSSRIFDVKEYFEKEYPGLTVEIKDIRGNDVVAMLTANYENKEYDCDIVICSDCDGSLRLELIEKKIVYPYLPEDIATHIKYKSEDGDVLFLGECILFFYNNYLFLESPIQNIWELTESKYYQKIVMANPLSSFSSFFFFSSIIIQTEAFFCSYFPAKVSLFVSV